MVRSLLIALVATFGVAFAQETATAPAAPQGDPKGPPGLLAEMDDYKLTEGEFDLILTMLPAVKKDTLKPEQKRQIIQQWMLVVASAEEALEDGLDRDPLLTSQLELYKKQLLFERHQRRLIKEVAVTEEETRKYFEENPAKFAQAAQFRISRIVLPSKEKADEVSEALKAGRSFEELVAQYSTDDASKPKGGDIGWIVAGRGERGFEQVAAALELNQISAPVQTEVGWQIVRLTEKRPEVQKTYEEVQTALSRQLLTLKQRAVLARAAAELFEKHEVKIYSLEN
jgi:peptidyl-prolyl cis-trans isomerase C